MSLILMSGTIILGFAVLGSFAAWGVMPLIGLAYLLKPASITNTKSQECEVNLINLEPDSLKTEKEDHIVSLTDRRDAKVISCFCSNIIGVDIFESQSKHVEAEVSDLLINFRTWDIPYVIAIQQKSRPFFIDTKGVEMHTSGLSLLGEDRINNIVQNDFKLLEGRMVRKKDYDNFWYDVFNSALFSSDEYWRWPGHDETYFSEIPSEIGVSRSQDLISLQEIMTMKIRSEGQCARAFDDFLVTNKFTIRYATATLKKHFFAKNENVFLSTADLGDIDLVNWAIGLDQKQHKLEVCPRYDQNIVSNEKIGDYLDGFFGNAPEGKVSNS
ncbi:MAG: hypothetical protein AB8G05_00870 [Oligoflexales bacterium]